VKVEVSPNPRKNILVNSHKIFGTKYLGWVHFCVITQVLHDSHKIHHTATDTHKHLPKLK
jgi:hypothetical protein